ncbi:MAG: guanylate kinase [Candidatus Omnitrophota bacterium]|nr:MAG: guanylate kinase [Candidatus Omnitrophota bacterium]
MKKPTIFIFSGPGGAGKTTLVDKLFRKKPIRRAFVKGISFTTRRIRPGERGGRDYFFVSKEEFLKLKKKNFFLENEKVLSDYYGTPKYFFAVAKREKKDLILCIDVKGGMYLKKNFKQARTITIFISAPTEKELQARLKKRIEAAEMIKKRIKLSKKELQSSRYYDYVIINQDLSTSLNVLEAILLAEKFRRE